MLMDNVVIFFFGGGGVCVCVQKHTRVCARACTHTDIHTYMYMCVCSRVICLRT